MVLFVAGGGYGGGGLGGGAGIVGGEGYGYSTFSPVPGRGGVLDPPQSTQPEVFRPSGKHGGASVRTRDGPPNQVRQDFKVCAISSREEIKGTGLLAPWFVPCRDAASPTPRKPWESKEKTTLVLSQGVQLNFM